MKPDKTDQKQDKRNVDNKCLIEMQWAPVLLKTSGQFNQKTLTLFPYWIFFYANFCWRQFRVFGHISNKKTEQKKNPNHSFTLEKKEAWPLFVFALPVSARMNESNLLETRSASITTVTSLLLCKWSLPIAVYCTTKVNLSISHFLRFPIATRLPCTPSSMWGTWRPRFRAWSTRLRWFSYRLMSWYLRRWHRR